MVKVLVCGLELYEFKLQSRKAMNVLTLRAMNYIVSQVLFFNNCFGIEKPSNIDIPLNMKQDQI